MSAEITEHTLVELQMRLAFQEDTIGQLSDQLALQANELRRMQLQLLALNHKLNELMQSNDGQPQKTDERPPHY